LKSKIFLGLKFQKMKKKKYKMIFRRPTMETCMNLT